MIFSPETTRALGYYSVVRFVPDPNRDEAINVGLVLVAEGADWARFRVKVPRTRLDAIGRRQDVEVIERWADTITTVYEVDGEPGFTRAGRLSVGTLREWASEFGGILRLSEPRVAMDTDMESLWVDLFRRYVGRGGGEYAQLRAAEPRPVTGGHERRDIIRGLLATMERWHAFDPTRVVRDEPFRGRRGTHLVDVAIVNHTVTAVAQALPLVYGTEPEVIQTRALLVDAAVDLPEEVLKIGLYDDPPPERIALLDGTREIFAEIGAGREVQLVPRRRFDQLGPTFEGRFFPELK